MIFIKKKISLHWKSWRKRLAIKLKSVKVLSNKDKLCYIILKVKSIISLNYPSFYKWNWMNRYQFLSSSAISWHIHAPILFIYLFIFKSLYRVACSVRDWSSTGSCAIKYIEYKIKLYKSWFLTDVYKNYPGYLIWCCEEIWGGGW